MGRFRQEMVTEAKKLVRGEQYLLTSRLVNAQDITRSSRAVLTLGGESWVEDASSIKAAFGPRTRIVVVDKDPAVIQSVQASALEGVLGVACDLFDKSTYPTGNGQARLPVGVLEHRPYNCVCLDFCSTVSYPMIRCVKAVMHNMFRGTGGGALIVNFMYGRDNPDYFIARARDGVVHAHPTFGDDDNDKIAGRVMALFPKVFDLLPRIALEHRYEKFTATSWALDSFLTYPGHQTPMASICVSKRETTAEQNRADLGNRLRIQKEDLRILCEQDPIDVAQLYGTPARRIAAWRAVAARQRSEALTPEQSPETLGLDPPTATAVNDLVREA
jgi:hypothetical protein